MIAALSQNASPRAATPPRCPDGMILIEAFCIDRWEAHVVELDAVGVAHPHSPFEPVEGLEVRAETAPGVFPQGYISKQQAARACANARKRLCSSREFVRACRGSAGESAYPYGGSKRLQGYCNEGKGSSMPLFFGANPAMWSTSDFNDGRLNRASGRLAMTGSFPGCASPDGVMDAVGNLHEWVADLAAANGHAQMRGGFYGDAEENGHGCQYVTTAHGPAYHDYSTGFRCCAAPLR
jgi:hypothetical protein